MLLVVAVVTWLAYWDEQREAKAALADFARERSTFAASLAAGLSAHLSPVDDTSSGRGTGKTLMEASAAVRRVEHAGESLILLQPPGDDDFHTSDGRTVRVEVIRGAIAAGLPFARLGRPEAAALGLPARTAYAGIATVDGGTLGAWHIASIETAQAERDREIRAAWRLVLGVAVTSGLVLAFGGIALRNQRKELDLEREVAVMAIQNERDEQLARATRAAVMGTFAMGITHEVSTPLGVILGRAEQILGRVSGDERAIRAAGIIVEQSQRLTLLVRSFLDLARGGAPNFARVDSAIVVRNAVALVDHRFRRAGVSLDVDLSRPLPMVQCDQALLEHALVNLLLNACEACESGGVVHVSATADVHEIAFVVTDDGVGIKPADAERATEPFFTTKPAGQGTGLGLAIASEIVKSHRGTLVLEPLPTRGTRARIDLPVPRDEVPHAA